MLLDLLRDFSVDSLFTFLLLIPALLLSLSFHEFAHAFVAYKEGDGYAKACGRMTINPLKHIDPIGFLMMLLVGFGWAKPVPVVTSSLKHGKRSILLVSSAGILMNLFLAFFGINLLYFLIYVCQTGEFFLTSRVGIALFRFFYYFVSINLTLAVFNLLPVPPLDGYRIVSGIFVNYRNQFAFKKYEQYGYIVLLILMVSGITSNIISVVSDWLYGLMEGLCNLIYGAFM